MAFIRPTLADLVTRIENDLISRLGGDRPPLRRAFVRILARVLAGAFHMTYGFLEWVARQVIPALAEGDYLVQWAALFGVNRKAATYAQGIITAVGTNAVVIPDGRVWVRNDGAQYIQQGEFTIADGEASVTVKAAIAGKDGNTDAGGKLTLAIPLAGIESQATIDEDALASGNDIETLERLRARWLLRLQKKPQGGAKIDYELWALDCAGVTRAWCYPRSQGPGTVGVRFMMDDTYDDGIPLAGDVEIVQDYIDLLAPTGADVYVIAPIADEVDYTIGLSPNTAAVQEAVTDELLDLLARDGEPGGTILLSKQREAVSRAAGEEDNEIVTPAADVVMDAGHIPVLGTITFQAL